MDTPTRFDERLTSLFIFGVVLFSPMVISIFDMGADVTILGIPLLIAYIFVAWAALIGLLAVVVERSGRDVERYLEKADDRDEA